MSVDTVNEDFMGRGGHEDQKTSTYTRVFNVLMTAKTTSDVPLILAHASIPNIYDAMPGDPKSHCLSVDPKVDPSSDGLHWIVTCEYGREDLGGKVPAAVDDPTDLPPKIGYGFVTYNEVARGAYSVSTPVDTEGNPSLVIENSAGMPFDPPVMEEKSNLLITIQRNEEDGLLFDHNLVLDYKDTINNAYEVIAGIIIPTYAGKMRDIRIDKAWMANGDIYWDVTYQIEVIRRNWERRVLDAGFYTKDSAGNHTEIQDENGKPLTQPVKLDGAGGKLAEGVTAVYLTFITKWYRNFGLLNLPVDAT